MSALITPQNLHAALPISPKNIETVMCAREQIKKILQGESQRLVVIVGPCSIHDTQSAYEYAEKLQKKIKQYQSTLCIIMRTYFEKARTITGWKGFIYDPDLNSTHNIEKGLHQARSLLLAINKLTVPVATEIVNPLTAPYFSDLLSWVVIGARTTESQIHRELASDLSIPVGFKNNTNGDIHAAIHAVQTAQQPHHFFNINMHGKIAVTKSLGNPYCHIVLRGSQQQSNYDDQIIQQTITTLKALRLTPRIMVDCSHGNSQKNHARQMIALRSVIHSIRTTPESIFGVMLESHLVAGRQTWVPNQPLRYGQSITDACMGWEETEIALERLHEVMQNVGMNGTRTPYAHPAKSFL